MSKYLVFSIIFFGYGMFAYNRKGVSYVIPSLLRDGLKNEQVGLILSTQNLAYAISKFLGGIISDRLSSKVLFSSGLLLSGVAAVLFASVDSVPLYVLLWFINGLAQGVGWPAIAKLLKNWFKPDELGTWWSAASASANVSGALAPYVAAYLISRYNWRFSLIFVGSLTIGSAIMAYLFIQDEPKKVASTSGSTGKKKILDSRIVNDKLDKATPRKIPFKEAISTLLGTKFIWVISLCYLVVSCAKTCIADWVQMYLMLDCKQSSLIANTFVSTFELGGFAGGIVAGYVSDLFMRKLMAANGGKLPSFGHPRMVVALFFAVITGLCLHLLHFNVNEHTSAYSLQYIAFILGGSIYGQIALFGVVATQSVMSEMSGTSHAIAALAANVGSIVAGLPFATLARMYSWSQVFLILEVITILTVFFMAFTSTISYRVEQETHSKKKKD